MQSPVRDSIVAISIGFHLSVAALALGTQPLIADAQDAPLGPGRTVAPGVTYLYFTETRGPWVVNVVRVDLRRADLEIRAVRALDRLRGRERVSDVARRVDATGVRVLAAVNGDFFELASGENENDQVIAGEWWKGLNVTDSPYDTYDNAHIHSG
jgi:hypothetical protein